MRGEPSTSELQALAARQQQQLDNQARLIAAREHRLRQVQEGHDGMMSASTTSSSSIISSEADRVRKLRDRVEAQEAKLRKLRALRGQVDQQRITNGSLSADLSSIRALFNEKEKELSVAAAQVEELTRQLEQLSSQSQQVHPGTKAYFVQLHLERLRAELMYRNKLNEQRHVELNDKKKRLIDNRENVGDLEQRLNELRERLQRKKQLNQQLATQLSDASSKSNKILTQQPQQQQQQQQQQRPFKMASSQVAAVEPFNRQQQNSEEPDVTDFTGSKLDAKYQTLPYNTRFVPLIFNSGPAGCAGNSSTLKPIKAVASVPPQVAEKPALPPKPLLNFKPLLPPRQNQSDSPSHSGDSTSSTYQPDEKPSGGEDLPTQTSGSGQVLAKSELPLKPKPLTLKKHVLPPPPPPVLLPAAHGESSEQQSDEASDRAEAQEAPEEGSPTGSEDAPLISLDEPVAMVTGSDAAEQFHEREEESPRAEPESVDTSAVVRRLRKGNLKSNDSGRKSRRVSFDPLALLLDASLEGELELVKKTALEVSNPSAANDEGITALHNAICAGHLEIVRFLVELGCDVNAQDSDGWTPLHCAASCNNLSMVKFLVEHGACIFAATLSDQETAAEKCEEDEEGFDGCSEYLYSIQEKLGILNNGKVYAVYDYDAQNTDELSFGEGDELTVLRKGDDFEREWWWSRLNDQEGYVPRNLLGLYPRMKRHQEEE